MPDNRERRDAMPQEEHEILLLDDEPEIRIRVVKQSGAELPEILISGSSYPGSLTPTTARQVAGALTKAARVYEEVVAGKR
jgi:hypothetical protein